MTEVKENLIETKVLDEIIFGRIKPHIYAFETHTVPSYLKVGDTYRPVSERLREWKRYYNDLEKKGEWSATVGEDNDKFFRDYAVHSYLERKHKKRLKPDDIKDIPYYSNEFFENTSTKDVDDAVNDIKNSYLECDIYKFYNIESRHEDNYTYERTTIEWEPRDNQKTAIENFEYAVQNGHKNLLMYAVMRFGKSFTALCCAKTMKNIKLVVVISAKADVKEEWKKNTEQPKNFENFVFKTKKDLDDNLHLISNHLKNPQGRVIVLFLTFQELLGSEIKERHKELFENKIDLLIVDETHFGARAEQYSKVLADKKYKKDIAEETIDDEGYDFIENEEANEQIKKILKSDITLHLSGTPYRILMGSEFKKEDIITFCQYSDIVDEQKKWYEDHFDEISSGNTEEWENPYYGFPQMVRFAFNPSRSAQAKLKELKQSGISYAFSALLKPKSIQQADNGNHKKFVFKKEVLELFEVIDGSKSDDNVLGFLDYKPIQDGMMCRHIVCVLPYRASCDALEKLIQDNKRKFKNLKNYEIINISGVENPNQYKSVKDVKNKIKKYEAEGKKTLTLTVNRMLTGSTVEQWDTMIYLKDTSSPQEYDQAIFRLQNQYIKMMKNEKGDAIKYNMKPQTLLVDFDPYRMFSLQEEKAKIYNLNIEEKGHEKIEDRINKELMVSPIISANSGQLHKVDANNIFDAISQYSSNKGVMDELDDKITYDFDLLDNALIADVINKQIGVGSGNGIVVDAHSGATNDMDTSGTSERTDGDIPTDNNVKTKKEIDNKKKELIKKFKMYYARLLFYTFLAEKKDAEKHITSLKSLIESISSNEDNTRIANHMGLETEVLQEISKYIDPSALYSLEGKIQEISRLARDVNIDDTQKFITAVSRFNKLSESEIATPANICEEMINLLSDESFKKLKEKNVVMLDIASKAGEFAIAICNKCKKLGIDISSIRSSILSIPTSSVAYEFTRRIYDILCLDTDCIAEKFDSYKLLEIKKKDKNGKETKEVDYQQISDIILQKKKFNEMELKDAQITKEGDKMQVEAVVGNPPYQKQIENTSDEQIYNRFMDLSYELSDDAVLITPAKFLYNAGKTPKKWNQKMLSDPHLRIARYEAISANIFPGTNINGGLVITQHNSNYVYGSIGFFRVDEKIDSIVNKVVSHPSFTSINSMFYLQNKFNLSELSKDFPGILSKIGSNGREKRILSSAFEKLPELFSDKAQKGYCKILGNDSGGNRTYKYISKKYLDDYGNLNKYKIIMSATDGASGIIGSKPARIVGKQCKSDPNEGYTQTFISIGNFDNVEERDNLSKYLLSRFARFMIGTLKATNGLKYDVWQNLPMQDFTNNSDIDWSLTIDEIDEKLFDKYNLSPDEREFIKQKIKPME